jgi:hypothetical protein
MACIARNDNNNESTKDQGHGIESNRCMETESSHTFVLPRNPHTLTRTSHDQMDTSVATYRILVALQSLPPRQACASKRHPSGSTCYLSVGRVGQSRWGVGMPLEGKQDDLKSDSRIGESCMKWLDRFARRYCFSL